MTKFQTIAIYSSTQLHSWASIWRLQTRNPAEYAWSCAPCVFKFVVTPLSSSRTAAGRVPMHLTRMVSEPAERLSA